MSQTPNPNKITPKEAIRELWSRGSLQWKLHPVQKKMLASIISQNNEITTICCSRRLGKTFLLCLLATEKCLQKPNTIVKYICPTKKQVKISIQPAMTQILEDCPSEMKAEFRYNEYIYIFPNGSQIQMAGTDGGHHESLRGGKADLWIVDEAGFCADLKYVVNSVLAPTTDTTGGHGILASTPSISVDHDFIEYFVKKAEFKGELIKYTIFDNPLLTKEKIEEIIARFPLGERDPEFRREYLCEIIRSDSASIIPEFTTEIEKEIVKEMTRPPFYDSYVSMDIGGSKDFTVVLFAYYDFKNAVIVIEDEYVVPGKVPVLSKFAEEVRKREEKLWTNPLSGEFVAPYLRIADNNNPIMLNELTAEHNLQFIPTRKDNREVQINNVRMDVQNKQIIINPRCKTLLYHMRNGTWAKNKKDFARSPDAGHYDALAALIYLVRNIQKGKNPYPAGYGFGAGDNVYHSGAKKPLTENEQAWVGMFKRPSSLKFKR